MRLIACGPLPQEQATLVIHAGEITAAPLKRVCRIKNATTDSCVVTFLYADAEPAVLMLDSGKSGSLPLGEGVHYSISIPT